MLKIVLHVQHEDFFPLLINDIIVLCGVLVAVASSADYLSRDQHTEGKAF